ncbi:PDGLE domain-containing protein [Micromonospora sp. WMMD558]|uniref:PDGLE domain-containing protein n=1 Tax=unclassified Micromonospora TaxID=2617518 RepID=UPI0012B4CB72|nr:PDGLE domain-containing protein [Micromonospora sp. WMMC415]QGN50398.1 cobalamin biosynthesis protein CbiM [Micromonospora sp. WMMC415]
MKKRSWGFVIGGLLAALLLAGVVSNFASSHPDGLDSSLREGCTFDADDNITGGSCPAQQEKQHEIGGPLADYDIAGIDNEFLSTGLSGVLGVLLTFAVAGGAFWLVRRRGAPAADSGAAGSGAEGSGAEGAKPAQAPAGRAG